jgi:hypothetical protein
MPWQVSYVRWVAKLDDGLDCSQGQLIRFLARKTIKLLEYVDS